MHVWVTRAQVPLGLISDNARIPAWWDVRPKGRVRASDGGCRHGGGL